MEQAEEALAGGMPTASRPGFVRRMFGVRQYVAIPRSVAARSTSMIAAAVAHTSSSSVTRSPVSTADATTSVGARSSFCASFSPATRFSAASVSGPRTRKRHGWLRWCVGAKRAASSSSSSAVGSRGSGPNALCVRRAAASSSKFTRDAQ